MKILVANHWLEKLGGSETFTYTLAGELVRQGHQVDLFTNRPGMISEKIYNDFGIGMDLKKKYDLILANHHTCVDQIYLLGFTIQTCHGIFPKLESPSRHAHYHVAISQEVHDHLEIMGIESEIILNGIDTDRFSPKKPVNDSPRSVLSLVHSDAANEVVKRACHIAGSKFSAVDKYKIQVWEMEDMINEADVVISLGRGAYEAMACGRNVVVYDSRKYFDSCGDGYIHMGNIHESLKNNCSGRRFRRQFRPLSLSEEILKHDPVNALFMRYFATIHLSIDKQVQKYLQLHERLN